ncbi:MAG: hypothetical protein KAH32_08440, partial [Chlamydiia bacterium]|nr:hypothetical protein [Chlamydiia bacterium]
NKSLQYIMDQRDIIFKGKNITMAPFGKVSTLLDADATEIDEKYTEDAKAKGYAEVALKEITSQEDRDYLQDINDVDNFNWTGDNIYKTNMFIKLKNPKRTGSSKGAEMRDTHIIGLMFEKVVDGVDSSSLVSKKTIENAAAMLLE